MKELAKGLWKGIKSLLFYALVALVGIGLIYLFWWIVTSVFGILIDWFF